MQTINVTASIGGLCWASAGESGERARRQPGGNEGAEAIINQRIQSRSGIGRLELANGMGAVVAHFSSQVRADLALHTEGPLLRIGSMKLGVYGGEGARSGIDTST